MRTLSLVTIALLLSGCASTDTDPTDDASVVVTDNGADASTTPVPPEETAGSEATATPSRATTTRYEGTISGAWTGGQIQQAQGTWTPVAFDVPADVTGAIVELVWDSKDGAFDLDLVVTLPDKSTREHIDGAPGSGEGYADLRLLDANVTAGEHTFLVRCKACASQAYEVYVTTFEGAAPPRNFSAVPG